MLKNSVERVLKDYRIPNDSLSELENDNIKKTTEHDFETLTKSAKEYVHTVVNDYAQKLGITKEFMKPENKIDCVRQLHEQGYFQLKDSVEEAAKALEVSEPSIYRYIQIIKKEK
ncbi:helix-turn-helix domain-containing protein [Companilactobacillus halodurans]|uniref:helix-turn-helix domain-containing protein n=1 Tax=Companilactobacillus halodurans TaxID=2584183 RepID=UPI0018646E71